MSFDRQPTLVGERVDLRPLRAVETIGGVRVADMDVRGQRRVVYELTPALYARTTGATTP